MSSFEMSRGKALLYATYFIGVCLSSISLLVFMNASVSFVITNVIGKKSKVGDDVGTLGFVDELVAVIACPIWGTISDRVTSRKVVCIGYVITAIALICFVHAPSVYPGLLLVRVFFSMGASALSTMVTAILPAVIARPVEFARQVPNGSTDSAPEQDTGSLPCEHDQNLPLSEDARSSKILEHEASNSFRTAGLVGTAAGFGALIAVFGFLRLPAFLQEHGSNSKDALRLTFYSVAGASIVSSAWCFLGLRGLAKIAPTRNKEVSIMRPAFSAFAAALRNDELAISYLGGFVARASSVGISLFIPLWVNAYFIQSGRCLINDPTQVKTNCAEAYKLASILTGVSQLTALVSAPLWGFLSARYRLHRLPLFVIAVMGFAGYSALSAIDDPRLQTGTKCFMVIVTAALVGLSQIGAVVCSLGLLGSAVLKSELSQPLPTAINSDNISTRYPPTDSPNFLGYERRLSGQDSAPLLRRTNGGREPYQLEDIKGSVAGAYSLAGGVGILILTKIGGLLFDRLSHSGPFLLLAGFHVILGIGCGFSFILRTIAN